MPEPTHEELQFQLPEQTPLQEKKTRLFLWKLSKLIKWNRYLTWIAVPALALSLLTADRQTIIEYPQPITIESGSDGPPESVPSAIITHPERFFPAPEPIAPPTNPDTKTTGYTDETDTLLTANQNGEQIRESNWDITMPNALSANGVSFAEGKPIGLEFNFPSSDTLVLPTNFSVNLTAVTFDARTPLSIFDRTEYNPDQNTAAVTVDETGAIVVNLHSGYIAEKNSEGASIDIPLPGELLVREPVEGGYANSLITNESLIENRLQAYIGTVVTDQETGAKFVVTAATYLSHQELHQFALPVSQTLAKIVRLSGNADSPFAGFGKDDVVLITCGWAADATVAGNTTWSRYVLGLKPLQPDNAPDQGIREILPAYQEYADYIHNLTPGLPYGSELRDSQIALLTQAPENSPLGEAYAIAQPRLENVIAFYYFEGSSYDRLTPVQRQTVQEVLSSSIVLYGNAVDRYVWDIRQGSTGSTIPGLGVASLPNGGLGPQILFPSISLHSYWFTRDASPELLADLLVEETFQRLQAQTTVAHLHTQQYGPFLNMPFEVFAQQFAQGYLRPFLEISQQSLLYEQSWSLQNQYRFFSPDGDIAPELDTSSPEYIDVAKTKLVELIRYSLHAQPSSLSDSAILRLVVSDPNFLRTVNDGFKESQYAARLRAAGVSEDNITIFHYFGMARPQGISILSGLPFDLTQ